MFSATEIRMTYSALKNKDTLEFRTSNAPDGKLLAGVGILLAAFLVADIFLFPHTDLLRATTWPLHFIALIAAIVAYVGYVIFALGRERHVRIDRRDKSVRIHLTGKPSQSGARFHFDDVTSVTLHNNVWSETEKDYEVRLHFGNGRTELLGSFMTLSGASRCQEDVSEIIGCRATVLEHAKH